MPLTYRQRSSCRPAQARAGQLLQAQLSWPQGSLQTRQLLQHRTPENDRVKGKLKPWTPGQTAGSCARGVKACGRNFLLSSFEKGACNRADRRTRQPSLHICAPTELTLTSRIAERSWGCCICMVSRCCTTSTLKPLGSHRRWHGAGRRWQPPQASPVAPLPLHEVWEMIPQKPAQLPCRLRTWCCSKAPSPLAPCLPNSLGSLGDLVPAQAQDLRQRCASISSQTAELAAQSAPALRSPSWSPGLSAARLPTAWTAA